MTRTRDGKSTFNRLRRSDLSAGLAVVMLSLLAGCGTGSSTESAPRTAADARREVFQPSSLKSAKPDRDASDSSPESIPAAQAAFPTAPVVAAKPSAVAEPQAADDDAPAVAGKGQASITDGGLKFSAAKTAVLEPQPDPSQFPGGIIPASPNAEPLPGGPRLLVPEKKFRLAGKPPALQVNYDDLDLLKILNMEPVPPDAVEQFPDWLRELDGKRIRLRGFMYPSFEQMMSAFILTRDTGVCCFGPNPKIYYLIGVKMKEGTEARYVENRPIDVIGTFHILPVVDDEGNWFQLYKISDAIVVN